MKKILFIIPSLGIGGAEKSLIELFNVINYEKYSVDLLLLESQGKLFDQINPCVNVLEADELCRHLLKSLPTSAKYLMGKRKIGLLLKRLTLSIAHKIPFLRTMNMNHLKWKLLGKHVPKLDGVYDTVVAYLQGVSEYYAIDKVTANRKVFWMHTSFKHHSANDGFERGYIEQFDKVVCVSAAAKNDFVELFPFMAGATHVFYNIINKDSIRMASREEPEHRMDCDGFTIVSVGRLHEAKGYDVSIPAVAKIMREYENLRFYIVGEGPERKALEKLIQQEGISDRCFLIGATMNPYAYMGRADIILQASRYEGYCIVLAEARMLNKPIVTTDFYGAREQIQDGKNGCVIRCDTSEIYETLKYMINNPDVSARFIRCLEQENQAQPAFALESILG